MVYNQSSKLFRRENKRGIRVTGTLALFALMGCKQIDPEIDRAILSIQATSIEVCRFIPTPGTIERILATSSARLSAAGEIAAAICQALQRDTGLAGEPNIVSVAGVQINGRFLELDSAQ